MDEKKTVKVSLGTIVCIFIIVLLVIALGGMYYYYNFIEKKDSADTSTNNSNIIATKPDSSEKITENDAEMKALIKAYILTDFGPQDNMKNVTIDSYKEITFEEYIAKVPGAPWTETEKTEFLNRNTNVIYGYCKYTIELIDADNLTLEGSKPGYQELNGNTFKSEAVFIMDKTTQDIDFSTTYGFGNGTIITTSKADKVHIQDEIAYTEITQDLKEDEMFYIVDYKDNNDGTCTLYGVIYKRNNNVQGSPVGELVQGSYRKVTISSSFVIDELQDGPGSATVKEIVSSLFKTSNLSTLVHANDANSRLFGFTFENGKCIKMYYYGLGI